VSIVWSIVVLSFSVWVAAAILPGIKVRTFWDTIVVSIIFGLVNFFLGWLLFVFIGVATLGLGFVFFFLTRLVVSALMLMLTSALTDRLTVRHFGWALAGALVIAVLSAIAERILHLVPGLPGI
jgi:putative membrane protein